MAAYETGAVKIVVGSDKVIGSGTAFSTYTAAGYLFKLKSKRAWYEIADVVSATQFTLSTRYSDSDNELTINSNVASVGAATTVYTGTLADLPVVRSKLTFTASETFTDAGTGILTGNASGTGTIDYDTGVWSLSLGDSITATQNINASYHSGVTLTGMPYQVLVDYTTYQNLPEISPVDTNFADIYTRAIRLVDTINATVITLTSIPTDSGTATPVSHAITLSGGEAIDTSASGATVTITCEDASETNKGVVELLTDVEMVLGADTVRAGTAANMVAKMSAPGAIGNVTPASTLAVTGVITVGSTVDGRDLAVDGAKLDTISIPLIAALGTL